MFEISLDVSQYIGWYYLLAIGIVILSFMASWTHKTGTPLFWGISVSAIIILLQSYLAPVIFGVLNYDMSTQLWQFVITGVFSVLWFSYIALTLWNNMIYGEAWK